MKYTECEGKLRYSEKEDLMAIGKETFTVYRLGCSEEECCSDEECCAEERTLIPVLAQALLKKILSAQFKLDVLLGPRDDRACEKTVESPPVKETSLLLQAAHEEMNTLINRLTRLAGWFV